MALIGKIRKNSWLLVVVIGVAMLAFILGDLESLFSGAGQEDRYGIGTVNGEKVDENTYNNVLQNVRNQIFQNKMQQSEGQATGLDENDERNAFSQAWTATVGEKLVLRELDKIGITVDDIELDNVLYGTDGFSPSPAIAQAQIFQDSMTGEFSANLVRQYLESLEESSDPEAMEQLTGTLDYVRQYRTEEKYNALLRVGLHATTLEGKDQYLAQKEVKNVSYAFKSFSKVSEDQIDEITEEDLRAYYKENKNRKKYEQKASRKINYFSIPVYPDANDTLNTKEFLNGLVERFEKSKDDSSFVMRFSEVKEFENNNSFAYFPEGTMMGQEGGKTYPAIMTAEFQNAEEGNVFGPYLSDNGMTISKVVRVVQQPLATVRHILLSATSDEEVTAAQKKADSIIRVIRAQNNFEEMVTLFTEDPGSKSTGGKYEDFAEGAMVTEFNDFSFNKPIGTLGSVKTNYGIHIIEVLGRREINTPIMASVSRAIQLTKSSMDNANSIASSLIYDLDDYMSGMSIEGKSEIFDTVAKNNGYTIRSLTIQDESPAVQGFGQIAEGRILRLAFEEGVKEGDISSSPIRDNDRIIIAFVREIRSAGVPSFENVKDNMRSDLRKERQAQVIQEEMISRDDLGALADEINGQFHTEGLTFSASNTAAGREPVIIGTAFSGLPDGALSVPVKGNNGVFVLRVDNTDYAPETTDFSSEQNQIQTQARTNFISRYRTALVNSADVVDNRKLRSFGIR